MEYAATGPQPVFGILADGFDTSDPSSGDREDRFADSGSSSIPAFHAAQAAIKTLPLQTLIVGLDFTLSDRI